MATHNTVTVTITDAGSMTEEEAGQIAHKIAEMIQRRFARDKRVTTLTPIDTTDTITITIT